MPGFSPSSEGEGEGGDAKTGENEGVIEVVPVKTPEEEGVLGLEGNKAKDDGGVVAKAESEAITELKEVEKGESGENIAAGDGSNPNPNPNQGVNNNNVDEANKASSSPGVFDEGENSKGNAAADVDTHSPESLTAPEEDLPKETVADATNETVSSETVPSKPSSQQPKIVRDEDTNAVSEEEKESMAAQMLLKDYANKDSGAVLLEHSPATKGAENLLISSKDKYAIHPCEENKLFIVVGLGEDIMVRRIKLSSYERYSGLIKSFQVLASERYPVSEWMDLGTYTVEQSHGTQTVEIEHPALARYLKIKLLSHYGDEYYCTLSQISVNGDTMLESFHNDWQASSEEVEEIKELMKAGREGSDSASGQLPRLPGQILEAEVAATDDATGGGNVAVVVPPLPDFEKDLASASAEGVNGGKDDGSGSGSGTDLLKGAKVPVELAAEPADAADESKEVEVADGLASPPKLEDHGLPEAGEEPSPAPGTDGGGTSSSSSSLESEKTEDTRAPSERAEEAKADAGTAEQQQGEVGNAQTGTDAKESEADTEPERMTESDGTRGSEAVAAASMSPSDSHDDLPVGSGRQGEVDQASDGHDAGGDENSDSAEGAPRSDDEHPGDNVADPGENKRGDGSKATTIEESVEVLEDRKAIDGGKDAVDEEGQEGVEGGDGRQEGGILPTGEANKPPVNVNVEVDGVEKSEGSLEATDGSSSSQQVNGGEAVDASPTLSLSDDLVESCMSLPSFSSFRDSMVAHMKNPKDAGIQVTGQYESIFKTLTNKIMTLEINQSLFELYADSLSTCYRSAMAGSGMGHYHSAKVTVDEVRKDMGALEGKVRELMVDIEARAAVSAAEAVEEATAEGKRVLEGLSRPFSRGSSSLPFLHRVVEVQESILGPDAAALMPVVACVLSLLAFLFSICWSRKSISKSRSSKRARHRRHRPSMDSLLSQSDHGRNAGEANGIDNSGSFEARFQVRSRSFDEFPTSPPSPYDGTIKGGAIG